MASVIRTPPAAGQRPGTGDCGAAPLPSASSALTGSARSITAPVHRIPSDYPPLAPIPAATGNSGFGHGSSRTIWPSKKGPRRHLRRWCRGPSSCPPLGRLRSSR